MSAPHQAWHAGNRGIRNNPSRTYHRSERQDRAVRNRAPLASTEIATRTNVLGRALSANRYLLLPGQRRIRHFHPARRDPARDLRRASPTSWETPRVAWPETSASGTPAGRGDAAHSRTRRSLRAEKRDNAHAGQTAGSCPPEESTRAEVVVMDFRWPHRLRKVVAAPDLVAAKELAACHPPPSGAKRGPMAQMSTTKSSPLTNLSPSKLGGPMQAPVDVADGYVHFSSLTAGPGNPGPNGRPGPHRLRPGVSRRLGLRPNLKTGKNRGGGDYFPHVYADVREHHIHSIWPLDEVDADGRAAGGPGRRREEPRAVQQAGPRRVKPCSISPRARSAYCRPRRRTRFTINSLKTGLAGTALSELDDPRLLGRDAEEIRPERLPNPIGLAAGFDKNAEVFAQMLAFGFGFAECGTVAPRPQAGNPPPPCSA